MTTRLHRSEVRHQLSRIARAGGPDIPVAAIEAHLGYPLAEADQANLNGIAAALAAVADALTDAPATAPVKAAPTTRRASGRHPSCVDALCNISKPHTHL